MHDGWWSRAVANTSRSIAGLRFTRTFVRGGGNYNSPRLAIVLLCAAVIALLVLPDAAAQATTDYDSDGDSLIEVKNLEQLNAIRWDLDGDGAVDDPTASSDPDDPDAPTQGDAYAAAFPNPAAGMGCPTNADDADDNDCIGYELSKSLDFNNDASYADTGNKNTWTTGSGWVPIADSAYFTATFDGNNRSITNLFTNRPDADYQGLFGFFGGSAAEIRNVRLRDVNVTGQQNVGGLVGYNYGGISNSQASGAVSGEQSVGGLAGVNYVGVTISTSSATGAVTGHKAIGGLVGANAGTVEDSYHETGAVMGNSEVGGLVGLNEGGTISTSHATGNVTGTDMTQNSGRVGGLVGRTTVVPSRTATMRPARSRAIVKSAGWSGGTGAPSAPAMLRAT